tara:strand:+ start:1196 stop:2857 length:1662 start_codon:yes stop_codon:yes gene_type:complete
MAKKQQPKLSYGPNMGLIAGEAQVAQSEANLGNVVGAFAQGFQTVFGAIQKEEEERAAKMEAYAAEFPGLEQMNFMANATNKQVVTDFLNTQRDEYNKLAATYEKTKDRKVMDQMNAIKFSIANLDDQIKVFNQDKQEYRTAFDEDQLASGQVFDKDFYTNIFTNNAKFNIAENGDIAFDISGKKNKSNLYKDHAGNWTNRNNISESSFLEVYSKAQASGEKGNAFYRDTTYRALLSNLKATGNEGLQTFVTTDLTGDNSDFTFQQQWASGNLDDKFYKTRGKAKQENDTSWMFDNKNAGELRKLVADYYTDVVESGYDTGKENYKDPNSNNNNNDSTGFLTTKDSVYSGNLKRYLKYNEAKKIYDSFKLSTEGKDTYTILDDIRYEYSAGDNNWYYGEGDDRIDYGTPFEFLETMNISDPDFLSLIEGSSKKEGSGGPIKKRSGKINNAFNMTNNVVENGLAAGIFMQDDEDAAKTLQALLPPGFIIKKAGAVPKFFGVDKLTITSPDGTDLGTFDFGYGDSEKALEESKRFNSNVVEGDYFIRNNIVLGNL